METAKTLYVAALLFGLSVVTTTEAAPPAPAQPHPKN